MTGDAPGSASSLVAAAGWLGNACFFSRFFVQWWASERARRSVVPGVFWWLSLAGSILATVYAVWRARDANAGSGGYLVLLPGYFVGGTISARNLFLARGAAGLDLRWTALACIVAVALALWGELHELDTESPALWLGIGVAGQTLWVLRFPLQWWMSERAGVSHFPTAFWWLSLAGNLLLLTYALHLADAVIIAGYLPGPLVQARNLMLGHGQKSAT